MRSGAITLDIKFKKSGLSNRMKRAIHNTDTLRKMGEAMLKIDEPYVPMATGNLRKSGHVVYANANKGTFKLRWNPDPRQGDADFTPHRTDETYAHYIYEGAVMGPNAYSKKAGKWFTPNHVQRKVYNGKGMIYHTPNTQGQWDKVIQPGGVEYANVRAACRQILREALKNDR